MGSEAWIAALGLIFVVGSGFATVVWKLAEISTEQRTTNTQISELRLENKGHDSRLTEHCLRLQRVDQSLGSIIAKLDNKGR